MSATPLDGIPDDLWSRLAAAPHRLLMVDYDGTLAPFRIARDRAVPMPGSIERLRAIGGAPATTIAVVSGRPVAELEALLGPLEAVLVGEHGWERRATSGAPERIPVPEPARGALRRAAEAARSLPPGARLETKRASLVLHTRGLPEGAAAACAERCRELWRDPAAAGGLTVRPIDGGLELRAPGRDKGTAVEELIAQAPQGAFPVYLGDDDTDEDAFRAVREAGLGVRVGPGERPSLARARLISCEAVPVFLQAWIEAVAGAAPPREARA